MKKKLKDTSAKTLTNLDKELSKPVNEKLSTAD